MVTPLSNLQLSVIGKYLVVPWENTMHLLDETKFCSMRKKTEQCYVVTVHPVFLSVSLALH